jgi:hypothetical protein
MKHGTAKAKAIMVAVLKGEVKTAWGLVTEAFDFAGDTAIFVAIQEDAQNPIYKAGVAAIIMPVRADDSPACRCSACPQSTGARYCAVVDRCVSACMEFFRRAARQVWVAYCLSAVVSAISLVARGWITIDQLRQRRRDLAEVDAPRPYLHRLNAKIKDGQRTVNMVASPVFLHSQLPASSARMPALTGACTDTR